jgi:hypothetical protein
LFAEEEVEYMAARRMFAKAVVGSGRFLRLPVKSRLLYYDLGMDADDDGAVDVLSVLRKTGATERELEPLVAEDFVTVLLHEPPVIYINDWKRNNLIRKDRYTEGLYRELVEKATGQPNDNQRLTSGQPNDNQWLTQTRTGQDRPGQDRVGQDRPGHGRPGGLVPSLGEVEEYFRGQGAKNGIAERFYQVNEGREWKIDGEPVKNWKKLAVSWIENERKERKSHGDSGEPAAGSGTASRWGSLPGIKRL